MAWPTISNSMFTWLTAAPPSPADLPKTQQCSPEMARVVLHAKAALLGQLINPPEKFRARSYFEYASWIASCLQNASSYRIRAVLDMLTLKDLTLAKLTTQLILLKVSSETAYHVEALSHVEFQASNLAGREFRKLASAPEFRQAVLLALDDEKSKKPNSIFEINLQGLPLRIHCTMIKNSGGKQIYYFDEYNPKPATHLANATPPGGAKGNNSWMFDLYITMTFPNSVEDFSTRIVPLLDQISDVGLVEEALHGIDPFFVDLFFLLRSARHCGELYKTLPDAFQIIQNMSPLQQSLERTLDPTYNQNVIIPFATNEY